MCLILGLVNLLFVCVCLCVFKREGRFSRDRGVDLPSNMKKLYVFGWFVYIFSVSIPVDSVQHLLSLFNVSSFRTIGYAQYTRLVVACISSPRSQVWTFSFPFLFCLFYEGYSSVGDHFRSCGSLECVCQINNEMHKYEIQSMRLLLHNNILVPKLL